MTSVPKDHPRYRSLLAREMLERGLASGMTTPTGLIAHGRGETFDYLLGERTHPFAERAAEAAAALFLLSDLSVISINGNTAALCAKEMVDLAKVSSALLEINLFHDVSGRRDKIATAFREFGVEILGVHPDTKLPGLSSDRARIDSRGMGRADTVLVSLEDGDRTAALKMSGKRVIAIDLNPLSRTAQTADITIVDEVTRALPLVGEKLLQLKSFDRSAWETIVRDFDQQAALGEAERTIRGGAV